MKFPQEKYLKKVSRKASFPYKFFNLLEKLRKHSTTTKIKWRLKYFVDVFSASKLLNPTSKKKFGWDVLPTKKQVICDSDHKTAKTSVKGLDFR